MRKIKFKGSIFRRALLDSEELWQKDISDHTGINSRNVSQTIRNVGKLNTKYRKVIYGYYAERVLKPISYDDFWCAEKTFKEV